MLRCRLGGLLLPRRQRWRSTRRPALERLEERWAFNCTRLSSSLALETTSLSGTPLTVVDVGQTFELRATVPSNVFAAYTDVTYPAAMGGSSGPIRRDKYDQGTHLGQLTPGLMNDLGGFLNSKNSLPANGGGLLFAVPFQAQQAGKLTFTSQAPGRSPYTDLSVLGCDNTVPADRITWGSTSILVNRPPVLTHPGQPTIKEKQALQLTLSATDPDVVNGVPNTVTYSLAAGSLPGMSLNTTTGVFSWTPSEAQEGRHSVVFRATDNHGSRGIDQTVTITVEEINEPPTLTHPGNKTLDEKSLLSLTLKATDPDLVDGKPDVVQFRMVSGTLPGMSLDGATGAFTWTPSESQDGKHTVVFLATDSQGGGSAEQTVTITVKDINEPPLFPPASPVTVDELQPVAISFAASEQDISAGVPDRVTYSLISGQKTGMSLSPETGAFTWTPTEAQDGQHVIVVRATDRQGSKAEQSHTITVREVNLPPELADPPDRTLDELQEVRWQLAAVDPDVIAGQPDVVRYELVSGRTAGMTFDGKTGDFRWTPAETEDGIYSLVFAAIDSHGKRSAEQTVSITVREVLQRPSLTDPGPQSIAELRELSFALTARDSDSVAGRPDELVYSISSGTQPGMSLDPKTGQFRWTPTETQDGLYNVVFRVEDPHRLHAERTVAMTVREVNDPPVLAAVSPQVVQEMDTLRVPFSASERDVVAGTPDTVTFSLVGNPPSGAKVDPVSGLLTWTPKADQIGTHALTIRATDLAKAFHERTVTVEVREWNRPPTEIILPPLVVNEHQPGAPLGEVKIMDANASNTHTLVVHHDLLEIVAGTLRLKSQVSLDYETTREVTFAITATDSGVPPLSTTQTFTLTVRDVNEPPQGVFLAGDPISEKLAGVTLGTLVVDDPDYGQSHILTTSDPRFEIVAGTTLKFRDDQYALLAEAEEGGTLTLEVQATDSGVPARSRKELLRITVMRNPAVWHNADNPFDTSGDGVVAPQDVLQIINRLNNPVDLGFDGRLPSVRSARQTGSFHDTNGDGFLTPIDALRVINYLSEQSGEGESFDRIPPMVFAPVASGGDEWESILDVLAAERAGRRLRTLPARLDGLPVCVDD